MCLAEAFVDVLDHDRREAAASCSAGIDPRSVRTSLSVRSTGTAIGAASAWRPPGEGRPAVAEVAGPDEAAAVVAEPTVGAHGCEIVVRVTAFGSTPIVSPFLVQWTAAWGLSSAQSSRSPNRRGTRAGTTPRQMRSRPPRPR